MLGVLEKASAKAKFCLVFTWLMGRQLLIGLLVVLVTWNLLVRSK